MSGRVIGAMVANVEISDFRCFCDTMGAGCFQFKGTQQPMPAFPHQSLPRQCMPSPSLNRPLHLDQSFERGFGNRTAFVALPLVDIFVSIIHVHFCPKSRPFR